MTLPTVGPRVVNFGLALPMVGGGTSTTRFLAELSEEVIAAEASGFDLCLVPEHHGGPAAALSDPMVTVSWLLGRTTRIKVGTGVLILPLQSLPRLAEQACLLQHASGGRLVLGVGAGYQPADFAAFGVELSTRGKAMTDGMRALKQAWRTGELAGHPIRPRLRNYEPPPLYVGAWTSVGLRRAAIEGDGWIADPIRSLAETARAARDYRALAEAAGHEGHVVVMREAAVADTDAEAAAAFAPIVEPIFRYYLRQGAFPANHGLVEADLALGGALADRILCGSIDTLVDDITALVQETSADTVVLGIRHPHGPTHEDVVIAIEKFGRDVLPAVRSRLALGLDGKAS